MAKTAYPKRPQFFAHKVVRLLFKTCAAQDIGQAATLLVTFVAHTEDAKRYASPPTFHVTQLLPILGLRKWESLKRARQAAVDAGWLHYEPPPNGMKRPGTYWVQIPETVEAIGDAPIDAEPYPANGDGQEAHPPEACPQNGYGGGDGRGDGEGDGGGDLPYLTLTLTLNPNPIPIPKEEATSSRPPKEKQTNDSEFLEQITYPDGMETAEVRTAITEWLDYKRGRKQRPTSPRRRR